MRSAICTALLLGLMLIPVSTLAAEGRDAPNCLNDTPAGFSSSTVIGDGACIKVNLGVLNPGDVYDISIIVSQDALDVLVFDEQHLALLLFYVTFVSLRNAATNKVHVQN